MPATQRTRARLVPAPALLALLLLLGAGGALAQDNDDCLACHSDPELTGTRDGAEIEVFVDGAAFAASVHGDFDCVTCHVDLEGVDVHDEDVQPVDCGMCHDTEAEQFAASLHGKVTTCAGCHQPHAVAPVSEKTPGCGSCHARERREHAESLHGRAQARGDKLAPGCNHCHGSHQILRAADPRSQTAVMNVPLLCGGCHREGSPVSLNRDIHEDRILSNYSMSIHGRGLYEQGLTVTAVCTSCHTAHRILPHDDPRSSIHRDNVARTCAVCHSQIERVHRKVIEGRLWEEEPHKIPACVDCHSPHKIRRVFYPAGVANQDCLRCHGDPALSVQRNGKTVSLFVDQATYDESAHAETSCAQCHTDVSESHERACETVSLPVTVDCAVCHAEPVAQYNQSTHGTLAAANDPDAPRCLDCHSYHGTLKKTNPASPTFARNVPDLCGRCHRQGEKAAVRIRAGIKDIVGSYRDSTHGKGLIDSGLVVTATCADCHSAHGELPPDDPRSTINHDNVAHTCAKCHQGIAEVFRTSIHWPSKENQGKELPTCNTCHTSHEIARAGTPSFRFAMMNQCGRCHEPEAATFFETFHGKVSRLGSAGAAKCYDCHGTHGILPTSDPRSTLSRNNVVQTCGQCHAGSHKRFAGYLTHATHHDPKKYPWLFWSFWFMTALLVGTLTLALAHTLAWLVRLFLSRDEWKVHRQRARSDHKPLVRRFTHFNRILHLVMLISFFTLALSGMALKFSYMKWAQGLAWLLGGFHVMGTLHRMGAMVLVGVFLMHLREVVRRKRREKKSWKEAIYGSDTILFKLRDAKELVQSIRWFFGLGSRPRYGRYTYWEKFDYFAVLWGVIIIGSTGLVLWFPELFTRLLPGWSINVATIVHSDEALLAVGFIFTIHFFNTHFRPDKFPMDPVIFTGRVTLDELKYDKPEEYEQLVASGELEQHLVAPMPQPLERGFKVFGFVALAVGLALIALIIYAMLFGYK